MKTSLDCTPCIVRQALDAAKMVTTDPGLRERMAREVLHWTSEMNFDAPPPFLGQRIHRRLREITGVKDPYRTAKDHLNRMAMDLLPDLKSEVESAEDPLMAAVRLAIAGNVIDMGVNGNITESDVRQSVRDALLEPIAGEWRDFRQAAARARTILYLADNAGEIVFDRLLIEQLSPPRVTLAVRGAPVINDATMADACAVGLSDIVEIIDNGSDAPGTILEDCNRNFVRRFDEADLILAKGQGNFETLSDEPRNIFFLFKVKCPVIAAHLGLPVGTHVLARSTAAIPNSGDRSDARM
jgi:uncharacterized protein with ATP-grasp and redox domains